MTRGIHLYAALAVSLLFTGMVLTSPMSITNSFTNILSMASATTDDGNAHFETTDDPGSWFRSEAGEIAGTQSLAVIEAGNTAFFTMKETNTVHTVTSLLWPTGAANMPFDQNAAFHGNAQVDLEDPGLYVFVCKLHPFMLAAVIADDPDTQGLDLGEKIDVVNGITNLPTSSDLATRLLRTFFVATNPDNWQDFSSNDPWHIQYPDVDVRITGGAVANLKDVLEDRYGQDIDLPDLKDPEENGVGEVLVDTQYETTSGKDKPGTATIVDAENWDVIRKVALKFNNPHNMWTDKDQKLIYQTNWFDKYLTTFDRETGKQVANVKVGEAPAHVMTRTDNNKVHVSINGGDTVAELSPGGTKVERQIKISNKGDNPGQPHAHWMGFDGKTMVTPNSNTADSTLYGFKNNKILSKVATGDLPIATGMMPDSSKYYVSNFLDNTISVLKIQDNKATHETDVNLLQNYDPVSGEIGDTNDDDVPDWGALPIQTPVSPDGNFVFTANTLSNTVTIIDTESDELVKALKCDAGCHGVNFGAKEGGGYYAYVSSKFANTLIVIDVDPDNNGNADDAEIVGRILLTADEDTKSDRRVEDYAGMGGQGVLPIPLVYNGWVQKLPEEWKDQLTEEQQNPIG